MAGPSATPRILSIQSTVVHGYVGNKCAVAPLNRLGLEVDAINSVQFCNHTGYPSFAGQVLDGGDLKTLVDGLDANGLLAGYTHLLTGYIGSLSLLETIAGVVARLRAANPDLVYGEFREGAGVGASMRTFRPSTHFPILIALINVNMPILIRFFLSSYPSLQCVTRCRATTDGCTANRSCPRRSGTSSCPSPPC